MQTLKPPTVHVCLHAKTGNATCPCGVALTGTARHVGHAKEKLPDWRKARQERQAAQQPKPLSPGQARRKMEHARKEADHHAARAAAMADYIENINYARLLLDRELALTAKAGKPGPR